MIDITVVIPALPSRIGTMLQDALFSVGQQLLQPEETIVEIDMRGLGPAVARNAAIDRVNTPWVAFLDDDDMLLPEHLRKLARAQEETGADVLWPWFYVRGGTDPFPHHFGKQWDPVSPHLFPITTLVRTSALRAVGGFQELGEVADPNDPARTVAGEDWDLWLRLSASGARFHHVPERTWVWRHHSRNTSGLPSRA